MDPAVIPFTRRRDLESVASHFVVLAVVVVPELVGPDAVAHGELEAAAALEERRRDDLEVELVGGAVARVRHVGGRKVHEGEPVVERVPHSHALLERQVQDAHDARHAELVRLNRLQQHLGALEPLLEVGLRARTGEQRLHEGGLRVSVRVLEVVQVERSCLFELVHDAVGCFRHVGVVEVPHGDELQAERVGEAHFLLAGWAADPRHFQFRSLRGAR